MLKVLYHYSGTIQVQLLSELTSPDAMAIASNMVSSLGAMSPGSLATMFTISC